MSNANFNHSASRSWCEPLLKNQDYLPFLDIFYCCMRMWNDDYYAYRLSSTIRSKKCGPSLWNCCIDWRKVFLVNDLIQEFNFKLLI